MRSGASRKEPRGADFSPTSACKNWMKEVKVKSHKNPTARKNSHSSVGHELNDEMGNCSLGLYLQSPVRALGACAHQKVCPALFRNSGDRAYLHRPAAYSRRSQQNTEGAWADVCPNRKHPPGNTGRLRWPSPVLLNTHQGLVNSKPFKTQDPKP